MKLSGFILELQTEPVLEVIFAPRRSSAAHSRAKTPSWSSFSRQNAVLEPTLTPRRNPGTHFHAKTLLWIPSSCQNIILEPIVGPKRSSGTFFCDKTQFSKPFSQQNAVWSTFLNFQGISKNDRPKLRQTVQC